MLRSILSVIAGSASWTVLWFAANAALMAAKPGIMESKLEDVGILSIIILYSLVFSIVAGFITGRLAKKNIMKHALALGVLQLIFGILAQSANWDLLPVWYHITFLALLIPGNLLGGKWSDKRSPNT